VKEGTARQTHDAATPRSSLILLNPGPVNVSERVRRALTGPDLCHREPEAAELLASVRGRLGAAFAPGGGYDVAVLSGSGTLAVEAAVTSAVSPGKRLLVINNGVYGQRMVDMARAHGIPVVQVRTAWRQRPSLGAVEAALQRDRQIEVIALVHHETTVGLLNPVVEIGAIAKRFGRTLVVDAVSGLAGDELDLDACGVALCVGTAGKCIQAFPGVAFVLVRKAETRRMRALAPRSVYLHLPNYLTAAPPPIPFTPALQLLAAFDEALAELLEETVAGRIQRYRAAALRLRAGFSALNLRILVPEAWRSNSLTTLALPPSVSYAALHDGLKERGFVIYEGQGRLKAQIFRVANMGALSNEVLDGALAALGEVLRRKRKHA